MSNLPHIGVDTQAPTTWPSLMEAALSYARMGWWVFPLQPFGKRPLRGSHGFLDATQDTSIITSWWTEIETANIGIDCGRSRLVVVDVDPRNGGDRTMADWFASHGPLPASRSVRTAGGGWHYYLCLPPGMPVPRKGVLGPGVEIQAAGGYVVAPPSVTLHGEYVWTHEHIML